MADLKNLETMVGPKNDSAMGPSGKKARKRSSLYMLVGGSSDVYDVTVNFEEKNGHWCQKESGARCHGNGNGKGQKYGIPSARDKNNPQHWCKHVQAALADVEGLAKAAERTAIAFGEAPRKSEPVGDDLFPGVKVKPAVPAFDKPESAADRRVRALKGESAADRLRKLEVEAEALREQVRAEEGEELREAVSDLIDRFSFDRVREALRVSKASNLGLR